MKVIIVGGGQVGAYIASLLLKSSCEVKIIENRENVVNVLKRDLPEDCVVSGNGTDPNVLEACGIADTDVIASVTGADETNLVVSTIAKFEFSVPRVIARVNNPKNTWLFHSGMGVDFGLNQADLLAHIVVEEMNLTNMLTLMKMSHGDYSIIQVKIGSESDAVNKEVKDLGIPLDAVLIAILRGKKVIIPRGGTVIHSGDNILAFADEAAKEMLNRLSGSHL